MAYREPQEIKAAHAAAMGHELGELYSLFWHEVSSLHSYWHEFVELFATKPTRLDILNTHTGAFFGMVQDALWDRTLLHICRLTDNAKVGGRANASLPSLLDVAPLERCPDLPALIEVAKDDSEFARDWRNRRIAHLDRSIALEHASAKPLARASKQAVDRSLRSIAAVLNYLDLVYFDSETAYDHPIIRNGARDLVYLLDDGIKAIDQRLERVRNRSILPGDLDHRDL